MPVPADRPDVRHNPDNVTLALIERIF